MGKGLIMNTQKREQPWEKQATWRDVGATETDRQRQSARKKVVRRCTHLAIALPGLDKFIDLHCAFDGHAETIHDAPISPAHGSHSTGSTAPLLLNGAHTEHAAPFGFRHLHRLRLPTIQGRDVQEFDVLLFGWQKGGAIFCVRFQQHNQWLLGTVTHGSKCSQSNKRLNPFRTIGANQQLQPSPFTGHITQSPFTGHSTSYSHHLLDTVHHTVTKALHLSNLCARPWTKYSSWHIRQKILSIFNWTTVYTYMWLQDSLFLNKDACIFMQYTESNVQLSVKWKIIQ